jgi:hypothetical protein
LTPSCFINPVHIHTQFFFGNVIFYFLPQPKDTVSKEESTFLCVVLNTHQPFQASLPANVDFISVLSISLMLQEDKHLALTGRN